MQMPIVNNNGTSRAELLKLNMAYMDAARDLMDSMRLSAPHGRDYQTDRTGEAFANARREYQRNYDAAHHLFSHYYNICIFLAN